MFLASPPRPTYRCPGEPYDIPRGVHLARIAAGFERCAGCQHRDGAALVERNGDASLLGTTFSTASASTTDASATIHSPLFQRDGVRGVYLNEITRYEAGRIAGAFASCLWDEMGLANETPETAPNPQTESSAGLFEMAEGVTLLPSGRPGPTVVLARDERPAGPDLVMGVGVALRRMGCQVIDLGPVTRPCFWFAIDHLRAAGGVHVTGSGTDPSGIGLDFVSQGVSPCSRGRMLDRIEARWNEGYSRPTRRPGSQRLFNPTVPYEAGLWKHFHALRPLRIALGCSSRLLRDLLQRLFHNVACRLIPVETPTRARSLFDPADPDLARVMRAVRDERADLGILIADDGQQCVVVDDRAKPISPAAFLQLLGNHEREQKPDGRILDLDRGDDLDGGAGPSLERQALAARESDVICVGSHGRYWFREGFPTCDAVLTLVRLLQRLSQSDCPLSEI